MASDVSSSVQVFIWGIDPSRSGHGGKYTYIAKVDLHTATINDLYQAIALKTGIGDSLLKHQFTFIKKGIALTSANTLHYQGIEKEDTLQLEWNKGLFGSDKCPICLEGVSEIERRMVFCKQNLLDGTTEIRAHRDMFHVDCLKKLKGESKITCPLCRGEVMPISLHIP